MAKERPDAASVKSNDPTSFTHGRTNPMPVTTSPFAGRLGGNQEFTTHDEETLKKQPDAVCL